MIYGKEYSMEEKSSNMADKRDIISACAKLLEVASSCKTLNKVASDIAVHYIENAITTLENYKRLEENNF